MAALSDRPASVSRHSRGNQYDVIIVGAGPAGIFSAIELSKAEKLKVLLLEKGKSPEGRERRGLSMIFGWGGAGAFSDGKLILSTRVGGWLKDYVGEAELQTLIEEVERIFLEYGAPREVHGVDEERIKDIARRAALADLRLIPSRIRHIGTDFTPVITRRMYDGLKDKVEIRVETEVVKIEVKGGVATGVRTKEGEEIQGKYVIVAPGRGEADWLRREVERLNLQMDINPVDIGVRVETRAEVMEPLTSALYEPKLIYHSKSFDDTVRTVCANPYGYVIEEQIDDVITVNGHSYRSKRSENTNFAVLVNTRFTEPFRDPISYGKYIAKLANLLVGGVIVQRLGDLKMGRRTTEARLSRSIVEPTLKSARPGDLSFALPGRYLIDIKEMLKALDKIAPGVYSNHTLLYGIEVRFYSQRVKLSRVLETERKNLFMIGDGAGVTRGLVQAAASGILVGREILRREGLLGR